MAQAPTTPGPTKDLIVLEQGSPVLVDRDSEEFWAAAEAGRFVIQRCRKCSTHQFPPVGMCRKCHQLEFDWVEAGTGWTAQSWIVVHHPVFPHFAGQVPYTVVLAQMEDGCRLVARWLGATPPVAGADVEVTVATVGGTVSLVAVSR